MVRLNKALAIALFVPSIAALAQSPSVPTPAERFVAASVKPADQRLGGRAGPDHFYTVTTLTGLLGDAFNSQPFLMFGLPDWASDERWEVSAKSERGRSRDEMRPLLRTLLEDRFALRAHIEKRELPVYELVSVRADGQRDPKLKPATGECDPFIGAQRPERGPMNRNAWSKCLEGILSTGDRTMVRLHNYQLGQFGNALRSFVRRPVIDKTGFSGLFDFVFDFRAGVFLTGDTRDTGDVPTLDTALRESLGLKLQSARGVVDVLVIDSVERPTPN